MKRFFTVFLILMLMIAPLSVNAAPTNYLLGSRWETTGLACSVNVQGLEAIATGVGTTFSSPLLDILPAIKKALGNKNKVTVELSGTISAVFANQNDETKVHLIARAKINMSNGEAFDKEYADSLKGDEPFYSRNGGNVMRDLKMKYVVKYNEAAHFSTVFTVTRNQVYSSATPNWYFCVDGLNAATEGKILALGFNEMSLTVVPEGTIVATPTPTPAPPARKTPAPPAITPIKTAAPTAAPTKKPTAAPTQKPTEDPKLKENFLDQPLVKDLDKMAGSMLSSTFIIIIVTGAIALFVTLLAVKNRKE
jgi:hypothetical protein